MDGGAKVNIVEGQTPAAKVVKTPWTTFPKLPGISI
jgi:hypothetical protein